MMRFIMPVILLGVAIALFFMVTNPIYDDIRKLRAQVASYDEALSYSKALESERDKLTAKYNSINRDDLAKLQKLLPENIDNIRLILEIEQIALPYAMALKDVKYNATNDTAKSAGATGTAGAPAVVQGGRAAQAGGKDYGAWDLSFSTTGTYDNFLRFTRDLESNLRIVDISSIQFSSGGSAGSAGGGGPSAGSSSSSSPETYKYDFKIKTYWLKN